MRISTIDILVSVIVPVYNAERYISETIESILNQSLSNIEIILVNDGSIDSSLIICEQYLQKDSRIKLVNQNNSGVSIARNNGLKIANGEYVFFMDSDDTIDSNFLNSSYNVAKKQNFDIVVVGEYCCQRLPNVFALPTWGQFLRHDFLKKHSDIRFPENIQPCEDGLFSHQLLALTKNIGENPHGIYNYRHHEDQNHKISNNNVEKVLAQIPSWFEILGNFYKNYNLFESQALHLALFIEHEPFQLRYLSMSLNENQKAHLHELIKEFMQKKVLPFLKDEDKKKLSNYFLFFIDSKGYSEFDKYYQGLKLKYKIKLFLIKFMPISKIRKKVRKELRLSIYR
ncbi:glycosyltransferase involved in cell wall biosynthesis [Flavobacterium chryseum]|uniref:glycosyltransferase family 2 protein n=1 Tax=Flavobacterium sp. P3160 TaxID=2512113 RepID=UPI001060314D|nr:glycosyltransferase [Flavobacterium sp. P3160]TDO72798.1 glycosyltransferase involved in cell wall biosynthesis [Flavobacterium sp. P3160]